MGADAEGIYLSASYVTGIDSAANKNFLAAMKKKFGADLKTPERPFRAGIRGGLRLQGRRRKGRRRPSQPRCLKALAEVSVDGPRGTIAMSKEHHAPLTMYLGQVQADGGVKVIQSFPDVDPGAQCPNLKP